MEFDRSEILKVEINLSTPNERIFSDFLTRNYDRVHVGFPHEYLKSIDMGIALAKSERSLISGKLTINTAAHDEIMSSVNVYKYIMAVLLKVFFSASPTTSEEELKALFPIK